MQVEVPAYSTTISITRYWLLAKLLLWASRSEERGWSRHRTKASWPCAPANSGYHRLQEDSLRPLSLEDPPTTLSSFPFWPRVRFLLTDVRFFSLLPRCRSSRSTVLVGDNARFISQPANWEPRTQERIPERNFPFGARWNFQGDVEQPSSTLARRQMNRSFRSIRGEGISLRIYRIATPDLETPDCCGEI